MSRVTRGVELNSRLSLPTWFSPFFPFQINFYFWKINCHSWKVDTLPYFFIFTLSFHKFAWTSGSITVSVLALPFDKACWPRTEAAVKLSVWMYLPCAPYCLSNAWCWVPEGLRTDMSVFVWSTLEATPGTCHIFFFFLKRKKKKNLLLLMFYVYRGLAHFRLDRSRGLWLLFWCSRRLPPIPHLTFILLVAWRMDHPTRAKILCFVWSTQTSKRHICAVTSGNSPVR